ncbi:MAG TPA: YggS family pyridoxal phosphate-dependent enzyme [Thermoguttaceae bacterium]|nr:YggS family pyridoxal phosphate-dependent enzyme [Thermoguttaceae bacterium]
MSDLTARIAENVAEVRRRIAEAAARSGRTADAVTLVAVTKYVGPTEVRAVVAAGCTVLGESRPQQFCSKIEALDDLAVEWHMIGHLQRNKVRRTLPLVSMVQSADSQALIGAIDRIAGELGLRMPILLEVNISGEEAKHGFMPDDVEPLLEELSRLFHIEIRGLMGMASLQAGADTARRDFAAMRRLAERLRKNCPPNISLDELSIGMSGDYEVAIEEGATIVRVGSALYEGIAR